MIPSVIAHWAFGPSRLLTQVTDEARRRCLAGMMSGETSMCFGLSEPGAGSDASMIQTRAVKSNDGWRITGRKLWTSNAPTAEWCIVFAITDTEKAARKAGGQRLPGTHRCAGIFRRERGAIVRTCRRS